MYSTPTVDVPVKHILGRSWRDADDGRLQASHKSEVSRVKYFVNWHDEFSQQNTVMWSFCQTDFSSGCGPEMGWLHRLTGVNIGGPWVVPATELKGTRFLEISI